MKKLILSLLLLPLVSFADEMKAHDKKVETKFLTVVKDVEVERLLGSSAELNDCRDKNKFDDPAKSLTAVSACVNKLIGNKDEAALKKLAENLKLQEFGVIKSKNVSEITKYLSKRMHKSLTGRDPDDKNKVNQKWENQKIVDQKVFVELYKNQLAKNSLFEISRFCFENLRLKTPPSAATDFTSYWKDFINGTPEVKLLEDVEDKDNVFFTGKLGDVDLNDEYVVYERLISGLTPGKEKIDADLYSKFFSFCISAIKPMCEDFKNNVNKNPSDKRGSSACLTFNKLESIRTTLRNTEKVEKQFLEMEDKETYAIQLLKNPSFYQNGKGKDEDSLDELTSVSSSELLQKNKKENEKLTKLEQDCEDDSKADECQEFLVINDGLAKATSAIETDLVMKKEIETARVKKLNGQSLRDYLKENGHLDLLEKLDSQDDDKLTEAQISDAIGNYYDAKKVAEIDALKLKVGKRQQTVEEAGDDQTDQIKENIKDSKEERARLAQVVMFNNIITSQLNLSKQTGKDTYESAGRNVSGWNKEKSGLDTLGIDQGVFEQIQETADGETSKESIAEVKFLDIILGKDTRKED